MNQVIVRPATLGDLDVLLTFEQQIIAWERPIDPTIRNGPDIHYYDLAALISSPDTEVVVAEHDSTIIASGYALIKPSEPYRTHERYAYLGFMYVVPEHRGKGINKLIVDALEAWSRSRGVFEMWLEVYAENDPAIRAYKKTGCEPLFMTMRKGVE